MYKRIARDPIFPIVSGTIVFLATLVLPTVLTSSVTGQQVAIFGIGATVITILYLVSLYLPIHVRRSDQKTHPTRVANLTKREIVKFNKLVLAKKLGLAQFCTVVLTPEGDKWYPSVYDSTLVSKHDSELIKELNFQQSGNIWSKQVQEKKDLSPLLYYIIGNTDEMRDLVFREHQHSNFLQSITMLVVAPIYPPNQGNILGILLIYIQEDVASVSNKYQNSKVNEERLRSSTKLAAKYLSEYLCYDLLCT